MSLVRPWIVKMVRHKGTYLMLVLLCKETKSYDHRNNRQNAGSYLVSVKKLSPQNGGFIRAKLARLRTFCAKANANF